MSANKENNKFNSNQLLFSFGNTECMICYESLADKNIAQFKCGHFCCFDDAVKIKDSNFCCPLCRTDLGNTKDKIQENDNGVTQLLPPLSMPEYDDDDDSNDDSDDDLSSLDSEDMSSIRSIVDVKRLCNVCGNNKSYFCELCFEQISKKLLAFK